MPKLFFNVLLITASRVFNYPGLNWINVNLLLIICGLLPNL